MDNKSVEEIKHILFDEYKNLSSQEQRNDVAKEVMTILAYCDSDFIKNIPQEIFSVLNSMAGDSLKDFYVLKDKSLLEQNVSNECKEIISVLYSTFGIGK